MQFIINISNDGRHAVLNHINDPGGPWSLEAPNPSILCASLSRELERRVRLAAKSRLYRKESQP